ncbi:MAG: caspase family protein [Deltaproteobacteria bacterium]|nr:MAG: caspase family protein [Deltaproteobacteria bacterium]
MLLMLLSTALATPPSIQEPLRTNAERPADAAVVVGIERYPFLPDVSYAFRDADAVNNLFVHTMGIPAERVTVLKGGNREQIQRAIQRGAQGVQDGGRLWVYFAGHGAATPQGEPLLVADDARQDIEVFLSRSVPITELTRSLSVPSTVVLDACWTGQSRDGEDLVPGSRFTVPVWALRAQDDVHVWTGASVDQTSGPYEPAQQGLFTYFWVGGIRGWADGELDGRRDNTITTAELQAYLRRVFPLVQAHTQTPTFEGPSTFEILRARGLERAPRSESLPALPGSSPPPAEPPPATPPRPAGPFVPPITHNGGLVYSDGQGRAIEFRRLQQHYGKLAAMKRVESNLSTAKHIQYTGLVTSAVGGMVTLIAAAVYGINLSSYNFWADRPDFGPDKPKPTAILVGTGIVATGGGISISGLLHQRGQRRKAARIVNEQLQ